MKVSLIVAMAENRVIGRNNQLPWYLPEDLRYFKRVTMGKPVVMGRKTFESIGKPLPGRTNIVVSRNPDFHAEGVRVVKDLMMARAVCESFAIVEGIEEVMVIGGAQIYEQALPMADRLYLTEVHAEVAGDALFPEFDRSQWRELGRQQFLAAEANPYDYSFVILERLPTL
jgi:dihydrofolate reductase